MIGPIMSNIRKHYKTMSLDPKICNLICVLITGKNLFCGGGRRFDLKNLWRGEAADCFIGMVKKYYEPGELLMQFSWYSQRGVRHNRGYKDNDDSCVWKR